MSGREFSQKEIGIIQERIDRNSNLSRRALSREICETLDWRSPQGQLKEMSCRVALVKLSSDGKITLPAAQKFVKRSAHRPMQLPDVAIRTSLKKLQPVELVQVNSGDRATSGQWNEMMDRHHPLRAGPLCGAQLRYLIRSANEELLGGLAFSAAAWRLRDRDRWIGWDDHARNENLHRVVGNSRFLILSHVQVAHLASHVLGMAIGRLQQDWKQRYGYEPLLLETFVETHYRGTSYRAANWVEVGRTQGRGRQDKNHSQQTGVKRIFLYALDPEAKQQLCRTKNTRPKPKDTEPAGDWAEEEFGNADLGHQRLNRRLVTIARDFYARPQAQIPQACQTRARTKAAYRFLQHPETTMDALLDSHFKATQRRIEKEKIVLAVQDTTSLNYSMHPATEDLGPIGSRRDGIIGLMVHDTMAFSREGTPLGLIDVQCWARDAKEFGKKHRCKELPIGQKESYKWLRSFRQAEQMQQQCPETTIVSIGDRESDVYELFHLALERPTNPKLLVRAEHDRLLAEGHEHLCSVVKAQPLAGIQDLELPRRSNRPARTAKLEIRFAEVRLKSPKTKRRHYGPVTLWAVLAQEVDAPKSVEALRWMLLTTCRVEDFQGALEKLQWYSKRWGIEVYHRTLKSGCKIEERQLGAANRIEACLAIDMVVAWRIYHLAKLGREIPDVPCTAFFEDAEWKALVIFRTKNPIPPAEPPRLREAIRMVASLGGFLGRKGDGEPGTKSLWIGLQRLDDITAAVNIFLRPPPVSSASSYG